MSSPVARADLWRLTAVLLCCAETAAADSPSGERPAVTPYRPSVSTPAELSAPGWLEAEAGAMHAGSAAGGWRESLPYTFKLAFNADWGIRFAGEALVDGRDPAGQATLGMGDLSFVLKRRFEVNDHSALGLELGLNTPLARAGLHSGSGATDYSLNGIYSADFGPLHSDVNLALTRLGETAEGAGHIQALWALAVSGNLNSHWGLVGEYSGTRVTGADRTGLALLAVSYSPHNSITWDMGMARGLNPATPRWSLFAGATFLVARLF